MPVLGRPLVQLTVPAVSCNATENNLLALETWTQLTQGMTPAEAALVAVVVESCSTVRA
jgi:hypothetical protein